MKKIEKTKYIKCDEFIIDGKVLTLIFLDYSLNPIKF